MDCGSIAEKYYGRLHPVGEPVREYKRRWLAGMIISQDIPISEKRSGFKHIGLDYDSFVNNGIIQLKLPETATGESLDNVA
jgi:hypothetical protein